MSVLTIALVGAPATGKSQLNSALNRMLAATGWPAVVLMPEPAHSNEKPERYDLTLLTGLEAALEATLQADRSIRADLARMGCTYEVLYGTGAERLAQAVTVIQKHLPEHQAPALPKPDRSPKPWAWMCDKCSDPQCEHRLLTDLLAQRTNAV